MHGPLGLLLHRGVDDPARDPVHEVDADEGALVVRVRALSHHGQQVGVQGLGTKEKQLRPPFSATDTSFLHFIWHRAYCEQISINHFKKSSCYFPSIRL